MRERQREADREKETEKEREGERDRFLGIALRQSLAWTLENTQPPRLITLTHAQTQICARAHTRFISLAPNKLGAASPKLTAKESINYSGST